MLHLYNKTFLEIHTKTYKKYRSIALNNKITANPHKSLFFELSGESEGQLLYYAPSLDAAISNLGGIDKVLQKIIDMDIDTAKTYVYCDYNDYLRLLCTWYKTIIPGFTLQAFNDIVLRDSVSRKYLDRLDLYDSQRSTSSSIRIKEKISNDVSTATSLSDQISNLNAVWASTNAVNGLTFDSTKLSLEFQFARYLKDGDNWANSTTYKNILLDFLLNAVIGDITEIFKTQFLRNLFVLPQIEEFNGFDPINDDLRTWMGSNHPFKFVVDPNFKGNNLAYVKQNYNLAQIGQLFDKYMFYPYHLNSSFYLNNPTYEQVMENEFSDKFGFRYFGVENDARRTLNSYLIYFIYNLSKNNPSRLVEFSV
jgi:hypothetical protein